jgi:periplasmic protein TonB
VLFAVFGAYLSWIKVPAEGRQSKVTVSERVATYIMQKPKAQKRVEPVVEVVPKEAPPTEPQEIQRERKTEQPLTQMQKQARDKVATTGIFKFKNQLAGLVDIASAESAVSRTISTTGGAAPAAVDTDILTVRPTFAGGAVSDSSHIALARSTTLDDATPAATTAESSAAPKPKSRAQAQSAQGGYGEGPRADEDVVSMLDQNKAALQTLYRKARRSNPNLIGRIVLEITVLPSGKVSDVVIKSSEINDPALEQGIVARVKQFDFGVREGGPVTLIYPIEFLPS